MPLFGGRYRHHLSGSQHLAEGLVLSKVEGALTPVIEMRDVDGAAIGESEFVTTKWGNASRVCRRWMIEVIARVKRGVAHELKKRAVETGRAGAGDDICET